MSQLGKVGEDLVAAYYQKLGFKVLDRNFIFPYGKQRGELDLIVVKKKQIVFIEVKARSNNKFGTPFESVDFYKQRKLVTMVKLYLTSHKQFHDFEYRIDVAAVDIDPIRSKSDLSTSNGVDNKENPVIILENAIEDLD